MTGGDVSRFQRSSRPATGAEVAARTVAVAAGPQAPFAAPGRTGPVVRVTRGKETTEEPVGKN
jgi:pilus assembly protein CpaB